VNETAAPALTLEHVYDVATRARLSEVEAELSRLPPSVRLRDPRALALRGMQGALSGDVPGGIALLRRAISLASASDRPYFVELVAPLLLTASDVDSAEELVGEVTAPPELAPALDALRAVILARRGRDEQSRPFAERALSVARSSDNPLMLARVLQRVALAAFYSEEFGLAQERAVEAARAYERLQSYRNAAAAYSLLYVIAHGWLDDPEIARLYAERMTMSAERSGDVPMQNFGLACQLGIAMELGDERRFGSIRARLLANPLREQYTERFPYIVSEAVVHMWAGRFESARPALTSLGEDAQRSLPERSTCDALIALCDAARGDIDAAKRRAHLVLSRTAHRVDPEPLHERQIRRIARVVAACTCILVGETTRGRRALSKAFDPQRAFAEFATSKLLNERAVPSVLRGYARAINAACEASLRHSPPFGLTQAELHILRLLPDGTTLAQIAQSSGRSRNTIARHVGSIYDKLDVSNRTQAVQRARELGLSP
jgi:ATP/maltotriose-dependent transcriptional regulator MalT